MRKWEKKKAAGGNFHQRGENKKKQKFSDEKSKQNRKGKKLQVLTYSFYC